MEAEERSNMVIGKKELISIIYEKTGLKKKDIKEMFEAFAETVYEELKKDNIITLRKLFRIEPIIRDERQRYNPITEQLEDVAKHRTVKMSPSDTLKVIIREAPSDTDIQYDLENLALERKIALLQAQKERLKARRDKNNKRN